LSSLPQRGLVESPESRTSYQTQFTPSPLLRPSPPSCRRWRRRVLPLYPKEQAPPNRFFFSVFPSTGCRNMRLFCGIPFSWQTHFRSLNLLFAVPDPCFQSLCRRSLNTVAIRFIGISGPPVPPVFSPAVLTFPIPVKIVPPAFLFSRTLSCLTRW